MAGLSQSPYRTPCWVASWTGRPVLTLCTQHKHDSEQSVPLMCNTQLRDDPVVYQEEGDCGVGDTWRDGNCYSECPEPEATGVITDSAGYAAGVDAITLSAGNDGVIYAGDRFTIAGDSTIYTSLFDTQATAAYSIIFSPDLAVAIGSGTTRAITMLTRGAGDFSACHKHGWKAVRASRYWHGVRGFMSACDEACDTSATRYRTIRRESSYALEQDDPLPDASGHWIRTYTIGESTGVISEGTCLDEYTFDGEPVTQGPPAVEFYGGWNCGPEFPETGEGASWGIFLNILFAEARGSDPQEATDDFEGTDTVKVELIEESDTRIEFKLTVTALDGTGEWIEIVSWELSDANPLQDVVDDCYGMARSWDLSDDVQYPWRPTDYGPHDYLGTDYHYPVPLVVRRETGPVSVITNQNLCGDFVECGGVGPPCPYDGGILGDPLPDGHGPHYAFGDPDGLLPNLGWETTHELPATATWWTAYRTSESDYGTYPAGGWVWIDSAQVVTVQVWAETCGVDLETLERYRSANFFRPCGADRANYPTAWPICGRIQIASVAEASGTVTVTLAEAADYLETGDSVSFTKYDTAHTETVEGTATVTVVSPTEFTYSGSIFPDATHVKSDGAPHFKWHDNNPKGDIIWCKSEYDFCDAAWETPECTDDCIQWSPCSPSVMAVLAPEYTEAFGSAAAWTLPAAPTYRNGFLYRVKGRGDELDPLYVDEDPQPRVESRCAEPDDAPAFPEGLGFYPCQDGSVPEPSPEPEAMVMPESGMRGLGDAVAIVAKPIAAAIDAATANLPKKMQTRLKGCGGCAKRQERLNKAVPFKL